ncbi:MAG: DUF1624 domain-containing protein [Candidatus Koribacter versatilis]|uniref:DUF1624 domain-containing protein n=1 Tax=Candidatus Korobacter versatilis TaxID=658062 RepID=A0A932A6I2_9BACT|nr:DUF1624 domain-containing protein [Candidatus Koribacter versatilis]
MPGPQQRLAYIDWMRGLACILMFQTHAYDAWLSPAARKSAFFMWSQLLGTFPAPLFLFLAGISFALVTDKLRSKGAPAEEVGKTTIRRGAEIYGFALLFRLQEFMISFPWAPWQDLVRMDVLNNIGISMMLMGAMCWLTSAPDAAVARKRGVAGAGATALAVAMVTPLVWTTWRATPLMSWMPWPVETFFDGCHNLGVPQAWLFPIFPWTAFAFAGLACGFVLQSEWAKSRLAAAVATVGAAGAAAILIGRWFDHRPGQLYAVYDFWHTSPNFFLIRVGMLMMIVLGAYAWCRWGAGQWGFSPLVQLGQTSLLVYWVHIEFVYGRFSILRKGQQSLAGASAGLAIITLSMLLLSLARTRMKDKKIELGTLFRRKATAAGV